MKDQENITSIEEYVIAFVKELRKKRKLTQEDIANIIGVERTYITLVESSSQSHKYNLRHINALADYFGLSPRVFLPEEPFPVDNMNEGTK